MFGFHQHAAEYFCRRRVDDEAREFLRNGIGIDEQCCKVERLRTVVHELGKECLHGG